MPTHRDALASLAVVLREGESWCELAEILERLAGVEHDLDRRSEHSVSAGEILERHVNESEWAAQCYQAALEAKPTSERAFEPR